MGRKSKAKGPVVQPFCYYCDREFDDENVLILHQKAKHFKCHVCFKRMTTIQALSIHLSHVSAGAR
jgi:hypothetical protein